MIGIQFNETQKIVVCRLLCMRMKNILQKVVIRAVGVIFVIFFISGCVTNGYKGAW